MTRLRHNALLSQLDRQGAAGFRLTFFIRRNDGVSAGVEFRELLYCEGNVAKVEKL